MQVATLPPLFSRSMMIGNSLLFKCWWTSRPSPNHSMIKSRLWQAKTIQRVPNEVLRLFIQVTAYSHSNRATTGLGAKLWIHIPRNRSRISYTFGRQRANPGDLSWGSHPEGQVLVSFDSLLTFGNLLRFSSVVWGGRAVGSDVAHGLSSGNSPVAHRCLPNEWADWCLPTLPLTLTSPTLHRSQGLSVHRLQTACDREHSLNQWSTHQES